MSQNSKLLNLTMIKQCKYSWKAARKKVILIVHAPVHDGNTNIRKLSRFYLIL